MCQPVYLGCPYCDFQRFFMWDECHLFWARYQYIVIDQGNFHLRPRLGRGPDEPPPACGGAIQEPQIRNVALGKCPRHECPSRQPALRPQLQLQHKMLRKRNAKTLPPHMMTMTGRHHGKDDGDGIREVREERRRKEFADRFFVKRPVQPMARGFDGADEDEDEDEGFRYETRREAKPSGPVDAEKEVGLSGQTLRVPAPLDSLPCPSEDLSQSCGSTIIESGSEVDSSDWNDAYQGPRGLKTHSV